MDTEDYALTASNIPAELRQQLLHAVRNTDYLNTEFFVERHGKKNSWCLRWPGKRRYHTVKLDKDDQVARDVRLLMDKLTLEDLFMELETHAQAVHEAHRENVMFDNPFLLFGKPDAIPGRQWPGLMDRLLKTDIVNTNFVVSAAGVIPGKNLMWEGASRVQYHYLGPEDETAEAVKELVDRKNRDALRRVLYVYQHRDDLLEEYVSQVKHIQLKLHQEARKVHEKMIGDIPHDKMLACEKERLFYRD